jgi:hypothetical protein
MPGIGELIEGAMQQAPHCDRHSISVLRNAPASRTSFVRKRPDRRPKSAVIARRAPCTVSAAALLSFDTVEPLAAALVSRLPIGGSWKKRIISHIRT